MNRISTFLFLIFFPLGLFAQSAEKEAISSAIRSGNAKALSTHLISSVDLTVEKVEDVYSRDQAEVILSRFFSQHSPTAFDIKHEGKSKLEDYYYIGDLKTSDANFRLTFFLKKDGQSFRIRQLRIEPTS